MERIPSGPLAGRTVLVTGGTGGIGKATAMGLATMGARLAITGRDRERTEGAAREIRAVGGQVDVFVADLSSQSEVRRLADEVLQSLPAIDVLVNNVGGYWNTRHVTADGLERTFALNHLAPFLLTNLLLDRLKQSGPARVVTVSSNAQAMGRIDFDDLQGQRSYSGARAYNQSKLANVLFTYELARRLQASAVTANALHPGVVSTSFGAEDPGGVQRLFVPLMRPFMKAPAQGAATSIHLASAPDLEQVTGRYFRQQQTQEILQAQLRPGRCGTPLADERRSGRPDRGWQSRSGAPRKERPMKLGVHPVNFTLPGGPSSIGPTLAAVGRAADEAGVANLSLMGARVALGIRRARGWGAAVCGLVEALSIRDGADRLVLSGGLAGLAGVFQLVAPSPHGPEGAEPVTELRAERDLDRVVATGGCRPQPLLCQ